MLLVLYALCFALPWVEVRAEKIPALAEISPKLPESEQQVFRQKNAALENALKEFITASNRFNAKPAKDQTDAEFDALTAQRAQYLAAARRYNSEMAARVQALESGDPMAVDARNVPSGLWHGMDDAIVSAYADTPPGVSDRVRKGFQAVMDRDWKVAKAWFEDALNRDPDNAGLKRLVALADSSLQPNQQPIAVTVPPNQSKPPGFVPGTDVPLPDPNDIYFLFPGLKAMQEKEMMDMLFGLDTPSPPHKPVEPKPASDQSMPLPPKAANKPNWGAFFDALFKNPPKSKYPSVGAVRG